MRMKPYKFVGTPSGGYGNTIYQLLVWVNTQNNMVAICREDFSDFIPYDSWGHFRANWEAVK